MIGRRAFLVIGGSAVVASILPGCVGVSETTYGLGLVGELDVLSYGAVGDGIVDDRAAIAAAIADAALTGATIFFPPGTYLVSSPLVLSGLNSGVTLMGSGADDTIVAAASGSAEPSIHLEGSLLAPLTELTLSSLSLRSAPLTSGPLGEYGISVTSHVAFSVEDCKFLDTAGDVVGEVVGLAAVDISQ